MMLLIASLFLPLSQHLEGQLLEAPFSVRDFLFHFYLLHRRHHGFGIALLPFFSAKTDPRLVRVLPEQVLVKRDLWLSAHEDTEYLSRIKALLRFLRETLTQEATYLNEMP